jgi:hypothetical protein
MVRRLLANIGHLCWRKSEDCGHGSFTGGHRFLHVSPALADQLHRGGEIESAGRNQGGIFAQAVPGDKIRCNSLLIKGAICGSGYRQNGGLGVFRLLQRVFGTLEAELRNGKSQRGVCLIKYLARLREFFCQLAAHARILRGLPGKEKCDFAHAIATPAVFRPVPRRRRRKAPVRSSRSRARGTARSPRGWRS